MDFPAISQLLIRTCENLRMFTIRDVMCVRTGSKSQRAWIPIKTETIGGRECVKLNARIAHVFCVPLSLTHSFPPIVSILIGIHARCLLLPVRMHITSRMVNIRRLSQVLKRSWLIAGRSKWLINQSYTLRAKMDTCFINRLLNSTHRRRTEDTVTGNYKHQSE